MEEEEKEELRVPPPLDSGAGGFDSASEGSPSSPSGEERGGRAGSEVCWGHRGQPGSQCVWTCVWNVLGSQPSQSSARLHYGPSSADRKPAS